MSAQRRLDRPVSTFASRPVMDARWSAIGRTQGNEKAQPLGRSALIDVDVIETLGFLLEAKDASLRRIGITSRTFTSFVEELGNPSTIYARFAFPVYQWVRPGCAGNLRVILIDRELARLRVEVTSDCTNGLLL
jgi:hypothetical protein